MIFLMGSMTNLVCDFEKRAQCGEHGEGEPVRRIMSFEWEQVIGFLWTWSEANVMLMFDICWPIFS